MRIITRYKIETPEGIEDTLDLAYAEASGYPFTIEIQEIAPIVKTEEQLKIEELLAKLQNDASSN